MSENERSSSRTECEDLPHHTHTYVLGADIRVAQRDCHQHEYRGIGLDRPL